MLIYILNYSPSNNEIFGSSCYFNSSHTNKNNYTIDTRKTTYRVMLKILRISIHKLNAQLRIKIEWFYWNYYFSIYWDVVFISFLHLLFIIPQKFCHWINYVSSFKVPQNPKSKHWWWFNSWKLLPSTFTIKNHV